jgi:cytochrome c peroxidase
MSLNMLRAPARRAVLSAPFHRVQLRTSFRHYSTSGGQSTPKSNFGLFAGLGVVALGGVGYYLYSSDTTNLNAPGATTIGQAVKAKAIFTPKQEDYQKVLHVNATNQSATHRECI